MTLLGFVAFFFLFYVISKKSSQQQCQRDLKIVQSSYEGIILNKYIKKVNVLEIGIDVNILVERGISVELFESAKVGDSIIKIKNRNRVLLKPENKFIRYHSLTQDCDCLVQYYLN